MNVSDRMCYLECPSNYPYSVTNLGICTDTCPNGSVINESDK